MQLTTSCQCNPDMQHTCTVLPELLVTFTCSLSGTPCTELPDLAVSAVSRLLPAVMLARLYVAGKILYPMMGLTASGLLLRSCCRFRAPLVSLPPCSINNITNYTGCCYSVCCLRSGLSFVRCLQHFRLGPGGGGGGESTQCHSGVLVH